MNEVRNSLHRLESERIELNVDAPKTIEPVGAEPVRTALEAGEQQTTVKNRSREGDDVWMENIMRFIRNIDVKSL
jgi:hypothetical protein